jgi:arylsulfatase
MLLHWPAGIPEDQRGTTRDQFAYVADLAPTLYEIIGVEMPAVLRGVEQAPISGRSFLPVILDGAAPATNTLQYFEMAGSRALVKDGWKAVCRHEKGADFDAEQWELYHLDQDASECVDLAQEQPERLAELISLWWQEAEREGVLPLDDRLIELFGTRFRDHSPHPVDRRYSYHPPMSPMPAQAAAPIGGRNFDLVAHVDRTDGGEGVLYATGTENSGLSVFVQDDRLVLDYNAFDDHTVIESSIEVPRGEARLGVKVRRASGRAGAATIEIDGVECGAAKLPLLMGVISSVGASVGEDHGSAVSARYDAPFTFSGTLHEVAIQVNPERSAAADAAHATEGMARQ